jgi:hypothetical protein
MNLPKTLKMPWLIGFGKRQQGIFWEPKYRWFLFGFESSSFQNCFWNLFSSSGLSQICKIRNAWKFASSQARSWSLKPSRINSKMIIFQTQVSKNMKFRDLQGFLMTVFEFIGQFFFRNDGFTLQEDFKSLGSEYSLRTDLEVFRHFLFYRLETPQISLKGFLKQFWKLDLKPKKPHILWFSENILLSLPEAT